MEHTSGTPEVQLSQEDIKKMEVAYKEYFCPAIEKVYEKYYNVIREKGMQESRSYPLHKYLEDELSKEENLQKILPNFYSNRDKNRYCDYA